MIRKLIRTILEESYKDFINENVGDFSYNKTFIVPQEVAKVAQDAITSTGSKLEKAIELSTQKAQTFNQMRKLRDFFTANQDNKDKNWDLHGGDVCKKWVEKELSKFHDENLRTRQSLQKAGGAGPQKGMGVFDTTIMDPTKARF
jgi:hypothetical protein